MINTSRLQLLNNLEKEIRSLGAYTRDTSRGLQLLMEWDKSHKTVYPCFYDYLVHIQRSGESNEMVDSFLAQNKPKVLNEEKDLKDNNEGCNEIKEYDGAQLKLETERDETFADAPARKPMTTPQVEIGIQNDGDENDILTFSVQQRSDTYKETHFKARTASSKRGVNNTEKEIDTISLLPIDKEERKTKKNAKRTRLSRIISLIFCCVGLRVDKEPNMKETFVAINGDKLELLERKELETEENHSI